MAEVYLRNLTLEGGSDPLEDDSQFISSDYGLEFIDQQSGEEYELEWHHLTDGQILEHGQDPESLKGAAAGALVGFLVAGPLGTAAGGLMGAGNAAKKQRDPIVGFSFDDGRTVVGSFDAKDIQAVESIIFSAKNAKAPEVVARYASLNDMTKTCTGCVEDIHFKATKCRHCGLEYSNEEIRSSIEALLLETALEEQAGYWGGKWVISGDLLKTIQDWVPNLGSDEQREVESYLEQISERHFENVLEAASAEKGLTPEAFFTANKDGLDIEDFVEAWFRLSDRMPQTEYADSWDYEKAVEQNWGLIIQSCPSEPTVVAKAIGYLIVNSGLGVANSLGLYTDGFNCFFSTPSRLFVGDEALTQSMLREFSQLGLLVHSDPHSLNRYPKVDLRKDHFDCSIDEEFKIQREAHVAYLDLEEVSDSAVEKHFLEHVQSFKESYDEKVEEQRKQQAQKREQIKDELATTDLDSNEGDAASTGPNIFLRLWKTVWYGGINFVLYAVLWSYALANDQTLLLVLLLVNVVTSSARLFAYKKWDYWFFLFLCGLGLVALAMSFSGNPLSEFIQPK